MGRIRTIKPEYWSHPIMARLPAETQLLALALLNHADDHGYFHADPAVIRGACCPFREDLATISRDLARLSQVGWIEVREHPIQGDIGFVVNWSKHQKVDHPKASKIEAYYARESVAKTSRELREVVALDQGSGIRDQGGDQGAIRDTPPRHDLFDQTTPDPTVTPIAIPFWLDVGGKDIARAEEDRAGFRELVVQYPATRTIGASLALKLSRKVYLRELVAAVLEQRGAPVMVPQPAPMSNLDYAIAVLARDGLDACKARIGYLHACTIDEFREHLEDSYGDVDRLLAASKVSA